jgi:hypothetical protein
MQPSIIQEYGYTWVALPKESLMPLTLLERIKEGFFTRLFNSPMAARTNSTIFDLFPKSEKGTRIRQKAPEKVPFFNGFDISKNGAGLSIKGLTSLKGIGDIEATGSLDQASMLLYNFESPVVIGVHTEILLEEHLNLTPPNENAAGYLEKLHEGKLYVVTEVLQCQEFSVEDASSIKVDGHTNIETLNGQLAAIKGNGNLDNKLSQSLTYKGAVPLTFAVKARQIKIREQNGRTIYSLFETPLRKVKSRQNPNAKALPDSSIYIE